MTKLLFKKLFLRLISTLIYVLAWYIIITMISLVINDTKDFINLNSEKNITLGVGIAVIVYHLLQVPKLFLINFERILEERNEKFK